MTNLGLGRAGGIGYRTPSAPAARQGSGGSPGAIGRATLDLQERIQRRRAAEGRKSNNPADSQLDRNKAAIDASRERQSADPLLSNLERGRPSAGVAQSRQRQAELDRAGALAADPRDAFALASGCAGPNVAHPNSWLGQRQRSAARIGMQGTPQPAPPRRSFYGL